jgi:hypothetical protein
MSWPKTDARAARSRARVIAAALVGLALAGCADSDLYLESRETVSPSGGDAVAANAAEQIVDPWPAHSGNNNIAFNGQRMQAAVERYRWNKTTPVEDSQQPSATAAAAPPQNVTQVSVGGSAPAGTTAQAGDAPAANPTSVTTTSAQ